MIRSVGYMFLLCDGWCALTHGVCVVLSVAVRVLCTLIFHVETVTSLGGFRFGFWFDGVYLLLGSFVVGCL